MLLNLGGDRNIFSLEDRVEFGRQRQFLESGNRIVVVVFLVDEYSDGLRVLIFLVEDFLLLRGGGGSVLSLEPGASLRLLE